MHTSVDAEVLPVVTNTQDATLNHQNTDDTLQMVPYEPPMRTQCSDLQPVSANNDDDTVQLSYEPPLRVNSSEQQNVLALGSDQQHILEPINELEATSQHISQALLNPKVRQELALVENLVVAGKDSHIPFTPYITKCQRKKITKATGSMKGYPTCSMGPAPSPPQ